MWVRLVKRVKKKREMVGGMDLIGFLARLS